MAEQASTNALVKVPSSPVLDGEYMLQVTDFSAAGGKSSFSIAVPNNVDATSASLMLRAAILKRTTWKDKDFATVLHAVMYADRMGLDIMAGDVYMAEEGRLSTTAGAKIRHAMASGKIEGYNVEITEGPEISIKYSLRGQEQVWKGPNIKARVTVNVKGFTGPVVYETTLREWFTGRNPNWRERPAYMLRKNALSKAMEEVAPLGVEADEAPPLEPQVMLKAPSTPAPVDTASV